MQMVLLGDIANIKYGKMPIKSRILDHGIYPIFTGYKNVGYYDEYNCDEKLIVVARGVGGTGDVKISPPKSYLTNLSIIIDLDERIADKKYLYYKFCGGLRSLNTGSAQPQITISDLLKVKIKIPDIKTQKKIADILGALDEKIELNRKMNETLEQIGQALFRHYFIDNPDIMDWRRVKINDVVLANRRGFSPSYGENGIPVINQRCIRNGTVIEEAIQLHNDSLKRAPDWSYLQKNDILVNSMGVGTLGRVSQVFSLTKSYIIHSCVTILRADIDIIDPIILGYYIKYLEPTITQMGSGTTGQTSLNNKLLGAIEITMPDKKTQEAISPIMTSLALRIDENYAQIQNLVNLRDNLLPRLINREIVYENI